MSIEVLQFPTYQPAMRIVTDITRSFPAIVTTTFDNQYLSGTIVRLYIPLYFGMQQINQLSGTITVINPTQFSIDINSTDFDLFFVPAPLLGQLPPGAQTQYAQVVPVGEISSMLEAATVNVLPYPLRYPRS